MEFLSNLAWAAVVAALWGTWLSAHRRQQGASLLPGIRAQLVALAMLSAILLVVISVTDDVQACQCPVEVARVWSGNDRHCHAEQATHRLPVALALLAFIATLPQPDTVAFLTLGEAHPRRAAEHDRTFWSRPPPSA